MELEELRTLYQKGQFTQLLEKLAAFEQTKAFQETESLPFSFWVFYKTRALIQLGKRQEAIQVIQNLPQATQQIYRVPVLIKYLAHSNVAFADARPVDALKILAPFAEHLTELERKAQPSERVHYWIGFYHYFTGLMIFDRAIDEAMASLEKAVSYFQKAKSLDEEAKCYYYLGNWASVHGKIVKGEQYYKRGLAIYDTIDSPVNRAWLLSSLGIFPALYGGRSTGNTWLQEAHDIFLQLNHYQGVAHCKSGMGQMYYLLGDIEQVEQSMVGALEYYSQAGEIAQRIGTYFFLVFYLTEVDEIKKAENYLHEQSRLVSQLQAKEGGYITSLHKFTEAFVLAKSPRLIQRVEAQKYFYQFLEKPAPIKLFNIFAIFQLCTLLIDELILTGNQTILQELQSLFQQQKQNIEAYRYYIGQIEILLLESRLALVNEDIDTAFRLVEQAETIAITQELIFFQERVQQAKISLEAELTKWNTLLASNPSIQQKIEAAEFVSYLKDAKKLISSLRPG
jgi:tetratricopeptide (TPR) repeat protein